MTQPADTEISFEVVERLAHLARLTLTDAEKQAAAHDMKRILRHVSILSAVDVDKVDASAHGVPMHAWMRDDVTAASLSVEDALANAPERLGDGFGVPKIIE